MISRPVTYLGGCLKIVVRQRIAAVGLSVFCLLAAGCGIAPPAGTPGAPRPDLGPPAGVPGFDTRNHPGEAVMAAWMRDSPYRWVGYYLPSPCFTGTTWSGTRASLQAQGWGLAVVFVGEQDWAAMQVAASNAATPADSAVTAPLEEGLRCTRANLSDSVGAANGRAAAEAMASDGFPRGSVVHLDVERVATVSPELLAYLRGWFDAVLSDDRYVPGLYAHRSNVDVLRQAALERFVRAGRIRTPPLWVAGSGAFSLDAAPAESGVPDADIWQGVFDVEETWAGTTLRIDRNVATSEDPSRSR